MAKLRIAGIGAGYFSRFHLEGWRDLADEVDVVGWCDTDAERAQAIAREFAIPRVFTDAAAMLGTLAPALVDVVTPPPAHAALVALAHARGIPVICQKPLTPSWGESANPADAADRAGVLCVVHENFRFQPWYREAKRMLDAGMLGALHAVAFRLRPGDGQGPSAYLDRQPYFQTMPRLLVVETAIPWIDTFRYLMGDVVAITARLRRMNPVIAGEDAGYLLFEFAGGASGLFDGNRSNDFVASNPRRTMGEMWLEGSAGVLRLDGEARLWWKPHHGDERPHVYDSGPATFGGGCCGALQRHVVAHLRTGTPVENTARPYLDNLRVQEAAYASHTTGRRIALAGYDPPATAPAFSQ
jgi:predicted dehydrogenase